MKTKEISSSKTLAFFAGAVVGGLLSLLALWAFEVRSAEAAAIIIVSFALSVGLLSAFAAHSVTEKILSCFLTLFLGP